jgi:small subunit ribosomal protein S17
METARNLRKERIGKVVSNKMTKSITIAIEPQGKAPYLWKIHEQDYQVHGS